MGIPGQIVRGDGTDKVLLGTPADDIMLGKGGNEAFNTGAGDDVVFGGGGSDNFYADLGNDFFDGGEGIDIIRFQYVNFDGYAFSTARIAVNFDLAKGKQDLGYFGIKQVYDVENVQGTNLGDKIYGNAIDNTLYGEDGDDRLDGRDGNDILYGQNGNDTLLGGNGDDYLIGDAGKDRLFSGKGAEQVMGGGVFSIADDGARDDFIYSSIAYSGTTNSTRDVVYGFFSGSNGDKIDVSGIDANGSKSGDGKFTFIGSNNLGSNDVSQVQVKATGNANEYMVKVDIDSDNGSEMQILVYSTSLLTASDFIL